MQADSLRGRRLAQCVNMVLALASAPAAWAEATLDGSMGSTGSFSGNFTIADTVGKSVGSNLFHSFSDFNINAGESATFTGPASINNIVSRVTGSNSSIQLSTARLIRKSLGQISIFSILTGSFSRKAHKSTSMVRFTPRPVILSG